MKIAAQIFIWLGLAGTILSYCISYYFVLPDTISSIAGVMPELAVSLESMVVPMFIVDGILAVASSIYAQVMIVKANRKSLLIAPGILCIIFASLVGGILTLCIPEDQLY